MTRGQWLTILQDMIAARIVDAPDEECRALAAAVLEEVTDMIGEMPPGIARK